MSVKLPEHSRPTEGSREANRTTSRRWLVSGALFAVAVIAVWCASVRNSSSPQKGSNKMPWPLALPTLVTSSGGSTLRAIRGQYDEPVLGAWSQTAAAGETRHDVEKVLKLYDKHFEHNMPRKAQEYNETLCDGIRSVAQWAFSLSRLLDLGLPDEALNRKLRSRLIDIAKLLHGTRKAVFAYVEARVLRGWPILVDSDDRKPTFDTYHFGHIALAISLGARVAATGPEQDHALAASMLQGVTDAMFDNFFSPSLEQTKLDEEGRVVQVPLGASEGRKERFAYATRAEMECLSVPVAINQGLMLSRAAVGALRAMAAIDWSAPGASWATNGSAWSRAECERRLKGLVSQHERWLHGSFTLVAPEQGRDGSGIQRPWYQWRYRDMRDCSRYRSTRKDRPEDVSHAQSEISFVREVQELRREGHAEEGGGAQLSGDLLLLIGTFLNRVLRDPKALGGRRFACDVVGTVEGDPGSEEQCGRSRAPGDRAYSATAWLQLATAARLSGFEDPQLECEAYRLVASVLPMLLPGEEFDSAHFELSKSSGIGGTLDVKDAKEMQAVKKWVAYAIEAKYYFYDYGAKMQGPCGGITGSHRHI